MEFLENHCHADLFPISLTRAVADIRVGIFTMREKWTLSGVLPGAPVPANLVPSFQFLHLVKTAGLKAAMEDSSLYRTFQYPWDLPSLNAWAIQEDILMLKSLRKSAPIPSSVIVTGDRDAVYIEEGAQIENVFVNTVDGPVYVGAGALVMDGAMLRGPVAVCAGAVVKMGTALYSGTTVGPHCTVGGEIKSSILLGYSNKGHEGYLGDAVIGEWCNIGAGSSCSNMRNLVAPVKVWHMASSSWKQAGIKCGLIMGDFTTCSINSAFNTGTVVGVSANLFQPGGLLPKFIPSFSWGADGTVRYRLDKAFQNMRSWMAMKQLEPSQDILKKLTDIYNQQQ